MSRLTGNDAKEMLEAYQAVYAPQEEVELTEEQVWEEVENWVNSLLEEGYDLSEYTWEEMYEAYFQLDEAIPLAIPAAMAAAPYVLPALGAAAYTAKALMNRGKTKNTPEQERFLSTGSFAASKEAERRGKEAAELNRNQNQPAKPAQPASTPVSGRTIRGERPRIRVAATRPQGSTTSTPGASAQQPKPEAPKPEPTAKDLGGEITRQSTTPGQSSAQPPAQPPAPKPPGFGEKLKQRMQSDTARRTAEREARRARPNPIGQAVQDKAVDLTARGIDKLATATKNVAKVALGAGVAGAIDQGPLGGVVGKSARDFTNWTKQAGPAYDKFMGRGEGITPPPPQPRRRNVPPSSLTQKQSFEMSGDAINEAPMFPTTKPKAGDWAKLTRGGITKLWDPETNSYQLPGTINKRLKSQGEKEITVPGKPGKAPQQPAPKPPAAPGAKQPGESLKDYAIRTEREASKTQPPATPAAQPPAAQPPAAQPPAPRQQAPAPAPKPQAPAPKPQAPAPKPQAPAQTGDRTRDLTTWALANKDMIDKVGTKSQREILKAAQTGGSMPAPRPLKASLKDSYDYDAFDFVLEYLLSEGHTDTLEEALYVMMEMDPETIQSICEGYQELNYKRRNRMTDQAMRHMGKDDDKSWEKAYSIENQRDTQTPEVSKAKAAANRAKGAAKRGKG